MEQLIKSDTSKNETDGVQKWSNIRKSKFLLSSYKQEVLIKTTTNTCVKNAISSMTSCLDIISLAGDNLCVL